MPEISPNCENCYKELPYNSIDAMICSFECTLCANCISNMLHNVFPNGVVGFEVRPHEKVPANKERYYKLIDIPKFIPLRDFE